MTEDNDSSRLPSFSVVIATYNYGHLIERAVKSVLSQSYEPAELIVVDDGSTDDTAERLQAYSGRMRYIRKENGGQSSAYNLGATTASGDYVYILDADDELCPDALSEFAQAISKARRSKQAHSIFYGSYESISADGKSRIRKSVQAPTDPIERLRAFIEKRTVGLQNGAFVIPRNAFNTLRYPEQIRHNTDLVFIGQALTRYHAIAIDPVVLRSHEHPMRSRKRRGSNIAHGTLPVDCLFDPEVIDRQFLVLKRDFLAARLRSLGRMNYLSGEFSEARTAYRQAFRTRPVSILDPGTLKRWAGSEVRSLLVRRTSD